MPEHSEEPRDQDGTAAEPSTESAGEAPEVPPADEESGAPASEQEADSAPSAEAKDAAPAKPPPEAPSEEPLSPKQLRKIARSRASGSPRPQRSPEERLRERAEAGARKAADRRRWRQSKRARAGSPGAAPKAPAAAQQDRPQGKRKVRQGIVVSNKPDKTITVRIDLVRAHPVYGKVMREGSTLHAHDERNQAREGDVVRVMECRPLSRMKRWRLVEVLEKAR